MTIMKKLEEYNVLIFSHFPTLVFLSLLLLPTLNRGVYFDKACMKVVKKSRETVSSTFAFAPRLYSVFMPFSLCLSHTHTYPYLLLYKYFHSSVCSVSSASSDTHTHVYGIYPEKEE